MEAIVGVGLGLKSAALELGLHGILVPVVDRVGDVIDTRRVRGPVARNKKGIAERQIALRAVVL